MEEQIERWSNDDLKGQHLRIFREETHGSLRLLICPNGIIAVLVEVGMKYRLHVGCTGEKIKKNTLFITVEEKEHSLPFPCVVKEIPEYGNEAYAIILLKE